MNRMNAREVEGECEIVDSVPQAKRDNRRFIITVFALGQAIGIFLAYLYWIACPTNDQRLFHIIVFYAAAGVTIPMFVCTMRLMLKGYYLSLMGWQSTSRMIEGYERLQKRAEPIAQRIETIVENKLPVIVDKVDKVVDKAVPIAEDVEKITKRVNALGGDVEEVIRKVRHATEAMNGSLNAKTLEEVRDSLKVIADTFSGKVVGKDGGSVSQENFPVPEFDPTKPRRERRGINRVHNPEESVS